ncbi:MAG: hypothetical protein MHPSP_004882, partial [Paramarteilia canceri]
MKLFLSVLTILLSPLVKAEECYEKYLVNCLYFGVFSDVTNKYKEAINNKESKKVKDIIDKFVKEPQTTIDEFRDQKKLS